MQESNWSKTLPLEQAARRAGGRRKLNAERHQQAIDRRMQITQRFYDPDFERGRGAQARLAKEIGVSEATVSRHLSSHRRCASAAVAKVFANLEPDLEPIVPIRLSPEAQADLESVFAETERQEAELEAFLAKNREGMERIDRLTAHLIDDDDDDDDD
jgi:DNA-binding transcriptional regulator YdaS (Cro superfamily)